MPPCSCTLSLSQYEIYRCGVLVLLNNISLIIFATDIMYISISDRYTSGWLNTLLCIILVPKINMMTIENRKFQYNGTLIALILLYVGYFCDD